MNLTVAPTTPIVRPTPATDERVEKPWPKHPAAASPAEWAGIEAGTSWFARPSDRPGTLGGHPIFLPQDEAHFTKAATYAEAFRGAVEAARASGDRKEAQALLQARDGSFYFAPLGHQSPDGTGEPTIYNDNGRYSIERGAAQQASRAGFGSAINALQAVVGAEAAISFDRHQPVQPNVFFPASPAAPQSAAA